MALAFQFLGPPQLILENQPVNVNRRSIVALLAYLAVNIEGQISQKHTREYLSAMLWPDYDQAKAYTNLRHTVWEIQRLFGPGRLNTSRDTISLNTQTDIWVDVRQFEALCLHSRAEADILSRVSLLTEAIKLYRNHFLTGFSLREGTTFNEWAFVKSKDIQNKLVDVLTTLCEDYYAMGQANRAIPFAQQLIAIDPLNESSHRRLMQIYLQTDQHNAALNQYQTLERTLRKEFNLDPQPETHQLYKKILKRDLKPLQAEKQPEIIPPKHNLPVQLSTFIGRDGEKAKIVHLLETNRLVTLAGVGGIGKTSLALQVGQKTLKTYPDGVWFIALDSLSDPTLVPQTIAAVLGIRDGSDRSLIDALINRLHEKTILLILDNCEHLLRPCTQLIKTLLQNCYNLRLLVTSREVLNLEGEATFYLPPLSIPEFQDLSLEKLTAYESIRLFTERAALALPSFDLTRANAKPIVEICNRVDGIPLAIELAAARVNVLQVEEILEQLHVSFRLPANDSRAILPRHQTLQLSMDWSWGLLDESEQIFLRQLSVFAGGWTLESALAVCDGNVLGLSGALAKKSLLVVGPEAGHMTRFRLHEIVRQYAREKLAESGEEENIRTRHLNCFLSLSEQAALGWQGPSQLGWYGRLMEERDNFRVSLELTRQTRNVESGLCLSGRLKYLWMNLDMQEGMRWLNYFLQDLQSNSFGLPRAQALLTQGELLNNLNRLSEAYKVLQECLALFRACGDISGEIDSLHLLAHELFVLGDRQRSLEIAHRALERSRLQSDLFREGRSLYRLGRYDPDSTRSFTYLEQAIVVSRQAKDWHGLSSSLGTAGERAMLDGKIQLAENYVKEAVLLCRQLKNKLGLCTHLQNSGRIAFAQGEIAQAFVHLHESIEICRETGHRMVYLWSRSHLGYFTLWQGEIARARDIFSETMLEFLKDKSEIGIVFNVEGMASLYVAVGKAEYAARLIGWANVTRVKISNMRLPLEQAEIDKIIAACNVKLGEATFLDAYEVGKKMTLDDAVAYALEENHKTPPF
jgi:predicted ATPase/DNA-binding SARP family transcriptional activator